MTQDLPIFVDTAAKLQQCLPCLEKSALLAIDTELDSFYSYQDQICLVQISTPEQDYIFDPLAIDIAPLAPLFADPKRTAIFHAGMNDIPHLRHEFGLEFAHIFDTYLAAGALNYEHRGLAALLEHHFGITLDKQYQRADWRQRPLSEAMLQYAREDTEHLFRLREVLLKELQEADRQEDADYAFAQAIATEFHPKVFDSDGWAKIKGINDLPRRTYGIVRELFIWRNREAQRCNIQPFRVMQDYIILRLASKPPTSEADVRSLDYIKHLESHPNQATAIYNAIVAGKRIGSLPWPKPKRHNRVILNSGEQTRLHALKEWRAQTLETDNLAPEFLLSNPIMFALAQLNPHSVQDLVNSHLIPPHTLRKYGAKIIDVLKRS